MNGQFKKLFSIILALLLGAGVILFAWKGSSLFSSNVSVDTISNAWKDALQVVPRDSSSKTLGVKQYGAKSVAATTTTDKLSRELLVDYALLKKNSATTTMSDTETQALVQTLIDKIEVPHGVTYSLKDLAISSDNSNAAFAAYSEKISSLMQAFNSAHTVNELTLVSDALAANDAKKLTGLTAIVTAYANLDKNLLAVKTPSAIAPLHLRLVQSYSNIGATITGMQAMFSDPIRGLAALTQYKKEISALETLAGEYRDYTPTR